jgi:hypothetical protein
MPAVIGFWRLPEEERRFLDYVSRSGDVVAFPFDKVPDRSVIKPHRAIKYIEERDPDGVLLALSVHASLVRAVEVTTPRGFFLADYMRAPVIIYSRGRLRDRRLGGCNLATYWSYLGDDERMKDHPAAFVAWAKRIYRWVRADTPVKLSKGWRATTAVAAAIDGGLEIVP